MAQRHRRRCSGIAGYPCLWQQPRRLCQWNDIYGTAEYMYLDDFESVLELIDAARDKDNVGALEG